LLRVLRLVVEDLLLRPLRALALLATDLLDALALGGDEPARALLDLVEQPAARDEAIQRLRSLGLALHADPGRPMDEHHARRRLVDVLPAGALRADERLLDVLFADAECAHARGELSLL